MSYPPPPGTSSLPARPPPSKGGFKPAFTPSSVQKNQKTAGAAASAAPTSYSSYPHRGAPGAQPSHYGAAPTQYGAAAGGVSAAPYSYGQSAAPQSYGQQAYGQQNAYAATAAPQIRNPFPQPGTAAAAAPTTSSGAAAGGVEYDAEMAAQIAQWQSAYMPRDPNARDAKGNPIEPPKAPEVTVAQANPDKTVVRHGGGKKWTDDTLLEWDPSHLRLFVGNLGGETTDDALLKAFSRWPSVQKARVVRDKRTSKSKGYGFVSFSDADDFFQAAKEMNNKYIQNRPVVVRKANTEIKVSNNKEKHQQRGKNNHRNKSGSGGGYHGGGGGGGGQQSYEASAVHKTAGGGVVKPGQKTKNGLRLLG